MSVLIILCHPDKNSFNHTLAHTLEKHLNSRDISVTLLDLYKERFNPLMPEEEYKRKMSMDDQVNQHIALLKQHSCLIFVHPDWWGGPPAMLKGWIERIFQPGIAYKYIGEDFLPKSRVPLLTQKKACVFFTTNSQAKKCAPLIQQWASSLFEFCGISSYLIKGLYTFHECSNQKKQLWIKDVQKQLEPFLKK